jgi:6-pyruvoyltetrahydropterin/6-carboxytetrahydropterin synthase
MYRIHLRKDSLKFSAAHMSVFPDGSKEALHGHNYFTEVWIDFKEASLQKMLPFSVLKSKIQKICQLWDEKVLLPENCPFLEIKSDTQEEIEFLLCKKRYILPKAEVVLLPVDNVTTESLSQLFCEKFKTELGSLVELHSILGIQVRVEEAPGQGCSFIWHSSP